MYEDSLPIMNNIVDEKTGIWLVDQSTKGYHLFDEKLAKNLALFFNEQRVVDLGCGMGDYVKFIAQNTFAIADGYDGNPNTEKLTNGRCRQLDLSQPIQIPRTYDWVLSLEVGEHIPAEFEDVFIRNLHHNNSKGIVLSWAVEGQGGTGHFNERNNDYIIAKISALGYMYNEFISGLFRSDVTFPWFANTIMVFDKCS